MYHVMSVKQSLREDLAEHSYQFSCRAADWSSVSFSQVPMQFEALELRVVGVLWGRLDNKMCQSTSNDQQRQIQKM